MRKLNTKKLIIVITLVAVLALFTTTVQATNGLVNPLLNLQGVSGNTTTNTTTNTTANTETTNSVKVNTTTNIATNNNTNLPQTGDASDYAIFLFIAICTVVAVYAYRKYRNYNI